MRENALHGFRRKFPDATIFGWRGGSALNQKGLMTRFIEGLDGEVDLRTEEGMQQLIEKWEAFVELQATDGDGVSPDGLGYATPDGQVAYYVKGRKGWAWVRKEVKSSR